MFHLNPIYPRLFHLPPPPPPQHTRNTLHNHNYLFIRGSFRAFKQERAFFKAFSNDDSAKITCTVDFHPSSIGNVL